MAQTRWRRKGSIAELPPTPIKPNFFDNVEIRRTNFGTCLECDSPNSGYGWCGSCLHHNYQQMYPDRTSGNNVIDTFITNSQKVSTSQYNFIEWIPYHHFDNIEFLATGGYGTVHSAIWLEGPISKYDHDISQFLRDGAKPVALKTFANSQQVTAEFFDEIAGALRHTFRYPLIPCYGITQNPETLEFAAVIHFAADCDLRNYMRKNQNIDWQQKLDILHDIARGLEMIHVQFFTHRNFHTGNILHDVNASFISDFGLSRSMVEVKPSEIFGVLPFVAPEVLMGNAYTAATDIYGFGIVMWELATGQPPFADRAHDLDLALQICNGLRPDVPDTIPPLYADLMRRCWNGNPQERPTASEIERTLQRWYTDIAEEDVKKESFIQFKNADKKSPLTYPDVKVHQDAIYTSHLLDFPELAQLLNKKNP